MVKFLSIVFFSLFCVSQAAYASHDCTRTVTKLDGTRTVVTDCSFEKTANPDIIHSPRLVNEAMNNFLDRTRENEQAAQNQQDAHAAPQADPKLIAEQSRDKEQAVMDALRIRQEELASRYHR